MFLSKITIKNFRLFKNFDLTLNAGLNLIVGENNSGKTALIDAIRLTLDTTSAEWVRIDEQDFYRGEPQFNIQLKFDDITPAHAFVFVEHLTHELTDTGHRKSVLYVNFEATLTSQTRRDNRLIKTDIKSGKNADGTRIEREIRNYLSATYLKPLRDAEAELAAGRGSRLSQILSTSPEFSDSDSNLNELIQAILDANKAITSNQGVAKSQEKIFELLEKLKFKNDQFKPAIHIVGSEEISKMSQIERSQTFKSILEKLNLSLDENSPQGLGYNNLLFMATELLLLRQDDDFSLLLIEEPEAHLHPQLQMKLLKFIREEFSDDVNPRLQSILTTHSPNLASKAPLSSLIIMSKGKAFSLRKGETQLDDEDYVFLEKFLDVTKSNLFFAKGVLIVEGDGENILLPTIAKLIGRPLENYGVSVVNVGNTAYARYAKIFKRKGMDENRDKWIPIKAVCLRDVDLWPDKAEEKPENEPFGFKEKKLPDPAKKKRGNLDYWKSTYNPTELAKKIASRKSIGGQNVKVVLSDEWTFEYSLALKGLAYEVYEAVRGSKEGFSDLPEDIEERAISIYKLVEEDKAKTKVAYELVNILSRDYQGSVGCEQLISKLPTYIIEAIEYVTEPL